MLFLEENYLVLLLLFLVAQGLLSLLLHPQLSGVIQHPLMVGHRLHLVDKRRSRTHPAWSRLVNANNQASITGSVFTSWHRLS